MKSPIGWSFGLVLLIALGVRLAAAAWWQSRLEDRFLFGDSESYWTLARAIAHGKPYRYGTEGKVFRTPGYPLLLAPLFLIDGDDPPAMWARAVSAVLGTLAVAAVGWLAWMLFDARAALLASSIAAIYPGTVALSVLVLSEAPFCPLMLVHLGLWIAASRASSLGRALGLAAVAGLAAGAATLMRPGWLLFTPFALAIGLAFYGSRSRQLQIGAAMLAGMVIVMVPWWIRNYRVIGHFVPTTLQVGASLYDGLSPEATGASNMDFVARVATEEQRRPAEETAGEPLEYRLDRRLRAESIAWARTHPRRVLQLAAIKLVRLWNVWPNEQAMSDWPVRLAVAATYVPLIILALWGAAATLRSGWPYALCWLPAVYFTLLHLVFVSSIRYREPAMLALIVLVAGSWKLAVGNWREEEGISQ